jgi:CheY-like chemotaxis protein
LIEELSFSFPSKILDMQLEYNILWIDNDIRDYIDNGDVNSIHSFLEDLGFEPHIIPVDDELQVDKFIDNHKYDLIISDFNLNATTGDVIIEKIRNEKGFSTEILFYSAKSNFRNDPSVKERLAFMDRITFHSNRDTFLTKVEKMIELTLDKLLELNATRGLITAATSDLDVEIEDIVMSLVGKRNLEEDKLRSFITSKVFTPLKKKLDTFWEKYISFQDYFHGIDAVKKWEIFRELLKPLKSDSKILEFLNINKDYQTEVIGIRNKFAHAKAESINGQLVLRGQLGQEDFQFDTSACIQIRRNIIKHKKNIENLKEIIHKINATE